MPEFKTYVDVDVDDFYDELDVTEKKDLIDRLIEDNYIKDRDVVTKYNETSPAGQIFEEAIDKITANRLQLTLEQEEYIISLAKSL